MTDTTAPATDTTEKAPRRPRAPRPAATAATTYTTAILATPVDSSRKATKSDATTLCEAVTKMISAKIKVVTCDSMPVADGAQIVLVLSLTADAPRNVRVALRTAIAALPLAGYEGFGLGLHS